jgi:molybdate transport system substrate-binding protein
MTSALGHTVKAGVMCKQVSTARMVAAIAATLCVLGTLTLSHGVSAQPADVRLFSSAAPRGVLTKISPIFEGMTGHRLVVAYDFSTALQRRIESGEPFDVAILPPDMADDFMQRGKLVAGSRVDLGRTGLGVAVRKDAAAPDVSTVDAFRAALLSASAVAYADGGASGVQFHGILARLGIAEAMKRKLRPYPSGGAVDAVARGEADLVVIGASAILYVPAVKLAGWLPPELQSYIVFTGSIGAAAQQPRAAHALLDLLTSSAATTLFRSQGFELVVER